MADVVMMAHDHEGNLAPKNVLLPDEYHGRKNGKWIIGKTRTSGLCWSSVRLMYGGVDTLSRVDSGSRTSPCPPSC